VCDDLCTLKELIAPDVVPVFVRVDDAFRHGGPHLAEQLDHLSRMSRVRLRVDNHSATPIDKSRVRIAYPVFLVQNRKAVVADLLQVHDTDFLLRETLFAVIVTIDAVMLQVSDSASINLRLTGGTKSRG
jgi:hypothetical protein